jgi:diguanylate cyclase (GGDEF)-like protein
MGNPRTLETLLDLTRALSTASPLEAVLTRVTQTALELLPCNHASLRLFNEARDELLAYARCGVGAPFQPAAFRPGQGVVGWVAETGQAARIDDTEIDPRFLKNPAQNFQVRSLLTVPLVAGGQVVGTLSVSSPERGAFGEREEQLAMLMALSAAPRVEQARLERLAFTDLTTGALNRRGLNQRLPVEMERAQANGAPLSVALIDLDRFKKLKFSCGAEVADRVLHGFADRMRGLLPAPHLFARHDGELFLAILVGADTEAAVGIAHALRDAMQRPLELEPNGIGVRQTISLGIASHQAGLDIAGLLGRAEQALHDAKVQGRNRAVAWQG